MTDPDVPLGRELLTLRDVQDVAGFFGISTRRLSFLLYPAPRGYRTFDIPKRGGGSRTIEAPPHALAVLQKKLATAISMIHRPKATAHGFTKGRSIVSNAAHHLGARTILNVDLRNFFHSIHFGRVQGAFQSYPFSLPYGVAAVLAQLCCHQGRLPQGAPTSPVLSNVVCRRLDQRLSQLGKSAGSKYSRYADDITFSTIRQTFPSRLVIYDHDAKEPVLAEPLLEAIESEGFRVATEKTRLRGKGARQEVTGVKINDRLNVHWSFVRSLRGALGCWAQHGYAEANRRFALRQGLKDQTSASPRLKRHLQGKLAYLAMVRGVGDPIVVRYALRFAELSGRPARVAGLPALNPSTLSKALWIVAGYDEDGFEITHSTAFHLHRVGFVTCDHGLRARPGVLAVSWKLLQPANPDDEYEIFVAWRDEHLDLAVLTAQRAPVRASLVVGDSDRLSTGTEVTLAGFPNWHPYQADPRCESGRVTQIKMVSGRRLIQFSGSVHGGNSGGPLLDSSGRVVGIAVNDASSSILPSSMIAIQHALRSTN